MSGRSRISKGSLLLDSYVYVMNAVISIMQPILFIVIAISSRGAYEIMWLHKISRFIKQPCTSIYLKKALEIR